MDSRILLARVSHLQAEEASDRLETVADRQQELISEKRDMRDMQEIFDKYTADEKLEFGELEKLDSMMKELGIRDQDQAFWDSDGKLADWAGRDFAANPWQFDSSEINSWGNGNNDGFYIDYGDADSDYAQGVKNKVDGMNTEIENAMETLEDDESEVQFLTQMATSDLQNAESVRQQAYKKMAETRKEGTQAWNQ